MSEERWQPFRGKRYTPRAPRPPDAVLWSTTHNSVVWSAEVRFDADDYMKFEIRLIRAGDWFMSHRFATKELAERWANEQRQDIERGWVDDL